MSFDNRYFYRLDVGLQAESINRVWNYKTTEDAKADVNADGYFNDAGHSLQANDLIYCVSTDDRELRYVVSMDPVVTADLVSGSTPSIPDDSITTAKLADGAVTEAKLAAGAVTGNKIVDGGILPGKLASNSVVAANIAANAVETAAIKDANVTDAKFDSNLSKIVGVATATATATASTDVTVTGATPGTDTVHAQVVAGFNVAVVGAVVSAADTVTVHWNGGTGNVADTVAVSVLRPTS